MITLALGIPRSATTWAFNVCRKLYDFQERDYTIYNPTDGMEMEELLASLDLSQDAIIHGHDLTPRLMQLAQSDDVRPFFNYRNPCDVVVSLMKLHDMNLDAAMQGTANAFTYLQPAMSMPGIMLIPYDHATAFPESIIYQMATKLSTILPLDKVAEINEETSYKKHKQVMEDVNNSQSEDVGTLYTTTREVRFSQTHLINDRHLQNGKNDRWRDELTAEEQRIVHARFAPLMAALGYQTNYDSAAA